MAGSKGLTSSGVSLRPTNLTGTFNWSRMPITTTPLALLVALIVTRQLHWSELTDNFGAW